MKRLSFAFDACPTVSVPIVPALMAAIVEFDVQPLAVDPHLQQHREGTMSRSTSQRTLI
jgi:hypothetical protein